MNSSFNSQNLQKYQSLPKHNKKRLNQEQLKLLEASFDSTKKLEPEKKLQLARDLGVPSRQISIWYQNRRARWKSQNLENDYNALQLKLETALSEKMQLEKETETLRGELQRANEMLIALKSGAQGQMREFALSSCCEDVMSYSTTWVYSDEANYNLQFDELYAMIGAEEGSNKCCSTW
ncbi:homeobox-leucine zipper protein ATHB-52 [Lycium ferocissimum]|uniref:homeobox-leucine zipper protein ATHB-52 n=1 Tax=Lycium ferocissimum TaxID=112874 RepID=UPI0028150096|nr:homeobox-leucine zipper protein ATHB-52 [Lycium ferocissimum]